MRQERREVRRRVERPSKRRYARRAVLVCFLLSAACARGGTAEQSGGPLLSSLQVYTTGDEVNFVLQIMNTGRRPLELRFPDGQTHDFVVRGDGGEVWRWSEDQAFTQAVRTEVLEPGSSAQFEAVWQPPDSVRGEFLAIARLTSSEHAVEQQTRFVID